MFGFFNLMACFGLLFAQEPDPALIRKLDAVEPGTRVQAAQELAELGSSIEKWLHKKVRSGSANRQRSLLLAAALLGSDDSWELIESEARRGRKAEANRAYALLLYGAYHPNAGTSAKSDWKRAATDFEKSCLLAGLLARSGEVDLDGFHMLIDRKGSDRQKALLAMLDGVQGRATAVDGEHGFGRGARLLTTLIGSNPPLPANDIADLGKDLPESWVLAAQRSPGRSLDLLKSTPLGGPSGAVVFALREVAADQRQQAFDFLKERVTESPSVEWLWGVAGELGLDLRRPSKSALVRGEVAGLLRLALRNFPMAETWARDRAAVARQSLVGADGTGKGQMEAAMILALAGLPEDHDWFKQALENGTAQTRERLQPLWLLATRKLDTSVARGQWLSKWSRDLGAGSVGFLDREGPRWVALSLVSGSLALDEHEMLQGYADSFPTKLDHPFTDEFYADLAAYLNSEEYRFSLR